MTSYYLLIYSRSEKGKNTYLEDYHLRKKAKHDISSSRTFLISRMQGNLSRQKIYSRGLCNLPDKFKPWLSGVGAKKTAK